MDTNRNQSFANNGEWGTGSSSSFMNSLGDEELIRFINKLSQERKAGVEARQASPVEKRHDTDQAALTDVDTDADTDDDTAPASKLLEIPSSPVITKGTSDHRPVSATVQETRPASPGSSFTLAQRQITEESDKISQRESPTPQEGSGNVTQLEFGDYATYFREKQIKQAQADANFKKWDEERRRRKQDATGTELTYPPIFRGCVIHVNGKTDPDISQLHSMIVLHGGSFLHYLGAKGNATHVIASKLTPRKHIEFKNYKAVKPEWIIESIAAQKLLHWADYAVINTEYGQKRLENFSRVDGNGQKGPAIVEAAEVGSDPVDIETQVQEVIDEKGALDAKHPDFLRYFFSKSRLHHLSTWKADLKYEFLQKALAKQKSTQTPKGVSGTDKVIFHVDFDCFFATVSALSTPGIDISKDPIAVTHGTGSADVASCNYAARKFGVRNGTWVRQAKKLCPDLICLGYNFEEYERISRIFYEVMINLQCDAVLPVSVDEVLLDVTSLTASDPPRLAIELAKKLKQEIYEKTKCSVSIGTASNVLLAKLALRKSKPNGIYRLLASEVDQFLRDVRIRDLPGVGYSIATKLEAKYSRKDIRVSFLRQIDKAALINLFGIKTGNKLYEYSRGIDNTDIDISKNPSEYARKSVSIDINWGIRFDNVFQVDAFLLSCSKEVNQRLLKLKMKGASVTLKLAKRAPDAPIEPAKYLGMGQCDFFTKSARLGIATREVGLICSECKALYRMLNVPPSELRGVSIQMTNLIEDDVQAKQFADQRRLPFASMAQDDYFVETRKVFTDGTAAPPAPILVDSSQSSAPAERLAPQGAPSSSSQYEIPSEIDSSVVQELPKSMQQLIERKKRQHNEPVPVALPSASQIDWQVFKKLPVEIQRELKRELDHRAIPIANRPATPTKAAKFHLQPVFSKARGMVETEVVRVISPSKRTSPAKRPRLGRASSPIDLDDLEAMDLDQDLKQETWQKDAEDENARLELAINKDLAKPDTIRSIQLTEFLFMELTDNRGAKRPILNDRNNRSFSEVKKGIISWVTKKGVEVGPDGDELARFVSFIESASRFDLAECIEYLRILSATVEVEKKLCKGPRVDAWDAAVELVRQIVDQGCEESNVSYDL